MKIRYPSNHAIVSVAKNGTLPLLVLYDDGWVGDKDFPPKGEIHRFNCMEDRSGTHPKLVIETSKETGMLEVTWKE